MPNTREKLIELLGSTEYGNGSLIVNNFQKGFIEKIADHLIANGVTFAKDIDALSKWIPVTERLPEPGVDVLCWYEYYRFGSYNRMCKTYGFGCYFRDGFWGGDVSNVQKGKVFAWMPLPEPPKGE